MKSNIGSELVLAAVSDLDEPWWLWGHLLPVCPAGGWTAVIWTDDAWLREGRDVCKMQPKASVITAVKHWNEALSLVFNK